MNAAFWRGILAAAVVTVWGGAVAWSQGIVEGGVIAEVFAPQGQKGQPYTCTRKITTVQKLFDGTTITRTTTSREARDSEGRTMQETKQMMGEMGEGALEFVHTSVMDPAKRVWIVWQSPSKVVNLIHLPDPAERTAVPRPATPRVPVQPNPQTAGQARQRPQTHTERLEGKMVAGLYAEGTRTTTTIPVGMMGNDRPLVTVREIWRSRELGLIVLTTNDDPRSGVETNEVTELDRGEPDPKLFQVPDGYTVKEQKQGLEDQ
jgi:hypothetical protein